MWIERIKIENWSNKKSEKKEKFTKIIRFFLRHSFYRFRKRKIYSPLKRRFTFYKQ